MSGTSPVFFIKLEKRLQELGPLIIKSKWAKLCATRTFTSFFLFEGIVAFSPLSNLTF